MYFPWQTLTRCVQTTYELRKWGGRKNKKNFWSSGGPFGDPNQNPSKRNRRSRRPLRRSPLAGLPRRGAELGVQVGDASDPGPWFRLGLVHPLKMVKKRWRGKHEIAHLPWKTTDRVVVTMKKQQEQVFGLRSKRRSHVATLTGGPHQGNHKVIRFGHVRSNLVGWKARSRETRQAAKGEPDDLCGTGSAHMAINFDLPFNSGQRT